MAEENEDLMSRAVNEYFGDMNNDPVDPPKDTGNPADPVDPPKDTDKRADPQDPKPAPSEDIPADKLLQAFNKLAGLNFDSIDKVKEFADVYQKFPDMKEKLDIFPQVVESLEKVQNPLNYFKDETAYKISQLSKDDKFFGKEDVLNKIFREDLSAVDDLKVIEMASQLNSPKGVRNPLRAELRGMGLDPDDVIDSYNDLDDDTKDLLKIKADHYRNDMSKIGADIKVPSFEGTVVQQLLDQRKATKEDLEARRVKIEPVAKAIVSEIKEIPITGDFKFKLELTDTDVKAYTAELTDILLSGEYDINTEEGKKGVYAAVVDTMRSDHFDKAIEAFVSYKTSQLEEDFRRRYNNEAPLDKREPAPDGGGVDKDIITQAAEWLVQSR